MSSDPVTDVACADPSQWKAADFEKQLNGKFTVDPNYFGIAIDGSPVRRENVYPTDAAIELELVEVTRRERLSPDLREDPFVLLFRGAHQMPLYGDVHVLEHPTMGKMSIFLTPVHASPGILVENHPEGRFYESVFN